MALHSEYTKNPLGPDQVFVVRATPFHNVKTVSQEVKFQGVIKRDCDNLTKEEIVKHKRLVDQAKLEELKRWHDHKCFNRMSRSTARNRVDGTWVLEWKRGATGN